MRKNRGTSDLIRRLNSVGKAIFVEYFREFKSERVSSIEIVELFYERHGYERTASRTRITNARYIIRNGLSVEALENVVASGKVPEATVSKAKQLLKQFT